MSWLPRQPPPQLVRVPHPDARVEAELQRVLSLQRAVRRREARLEDIRRQRADLEDWARRMVSGGNEALGRVLTRQSEGLRGERDALERELPLLHDEIAKRLANLGDDALMLYGPS